MAKVVKLGAQARKDLDTARRMLMSGDEKHFKAARKLIAPYKKQSVTSFTALDLLDRIKRWIENADMEVKEAKFLKSIVDNAKDPSFAVADNWYDTAISARALRYGGRFNLARRRYNKALLRMDDVDDKDQLKAEVLADYAEFWAYLGYTDNALQILARIPVSFQKGWLLWVYAFVEHQAAFTHEFAIGATVPKPIGHIPNYLHANHLLQRARLGLKDKEKADTYLLEAANWGGILRRLKFDGAGKDECDAAEGEAKCALESFRAGALVNQYWTWKKERRGMMVPRWVQNIDEPWLGKEEVKAWRKNLTDHYKLNLKAAGIELELTKPPSDPTLADGENGSEADPGDDDDSSC